MINLIPDVGKPTNVQAILRASNTEGSQEAPVTRAHVLAPLLGLLLAGCAPYLTVYDCERNHEGRVVSTPCLSSCDVPVEQTGQVYTTVTIPSALVIRDRHGVLHCEEIE